MCFTFNKDIAKPFGMQALRGGNCYIYRVNIYIHIITNESESLGYAPTMSSTISTIENNLQQAYQSKGIYFNLLGSRKWIKPKYVDPNTSFGDFGNIINESDRNEQTNALNIYVCANNVQLQGGYSDGRNVVLAGTRSVVHPGYGTINYEVPLSQIVSHEVGHCLSLGHTFYGDGDNISDTPDDYVDNQSCITPAPGCQFTGQNGACNLSSNPTTNMINFMSYTVPTCMSYFSTMQAEAMKNMLATTRSDVVHSSWNGTPDITGLRLDGTLYINQTYFNTTQAWHNVKAEGDGFINSWSFSPGSSCIMWPSQNWDQYNFYLNCSSSLTITASNFCGSEIIHPIFVIGYGWRFYPNPVKDVLTLEFDTQYNEELKKDSPLLLPDEILIVNEQNEKLVSVPAKEKYQKGEFKENKMEIVVQKLTQGTYYVHFIKDSKVLDKKRLIIK